MSKINIGLFGYGVVGEGVYEVVKEKCSDFALIKKIVIQDESKSRNAPSELFSRDANEILLDSDIDLVIELIDDPEAAYTIVCRAIKYGKSVISANKKMIASNLKELITISRNNNVSFLYEAAVCGSVPIIQNLENFYKEDQILKIKGVVNGSTNYILGKMQNEDLHFGCALKAAQKLGFAESDPSLDVNGLDASYKLGILARHAYGVDISNNSITVKGITAITDQDIHYARDHKFTIKLVATCYQDSNSGNYISTVLPHFISQDNLLNAAMDEYNGVVVYSQLAVMQLYYGKGAGRYPTSSAVLSDLVAYKGGYKYAYQKKVNEVSLSSDILVKTYCSFDSEFPFDPDFFVEIVSSGISKGQRYIVGMVGLSALHVHPYIKDDNVSIIAFDDN